MAQFDAYLWLFSLTSIQCQMPMVYAKYSYEDTAQSSSYQITVEPMLIDAIASVIQHYQWNSMYFLYTSDAGKRMTADAFAGQRSTVRTNFDRLPFAALNKLQQLYTKLSGRHEWRLNAVWRIQSVEHGHRILSQIEQSQPNAIKHILLDCSADVCKDLIVRHVNDIYLGRRNFHYLFTNLVSTAGPIACPFASHTFSLTLE